MIRCRSFIEATFIIKRLNLEFNGYLEKNLEEILLTKDIQMSRNKECSDFLFSQDGKILRDSYIAFLAVHDVLRLSEKNKAEIRQMIPTLKSEKELAHFENRDINSNPLFEGKRLKEFLPKHAGLDYLITGMFIEELLWYRNDIEPEEEYDFIVEF